MNYYRLQQVDFDGTAVYSDVASAQIEIDMNRFQIIPNPATDRIRIQGMMESVTQIRVFDALGKLVRVATGAFSSEPIDLSGCTAGLYFVEITVEGATERLKVLKR